MNLKSNVNIPFFNKVGLQEVLFFTKHLSIMLKAGIPITEALETSVEQTKSPAFIDVLKSVNEDIKNGKSLAVSLKKHPEVFDEFYTSLISIAEESGTLDQSLEFLALQLAKSYALRNKIRGALMYPAIVTGATFLMGGFIALFILPQLVEFFDSFDIELPPTTKVLVLFASLMKNYGILIFMALGVLVFAFYLLTKTKKIRPLWHSFLLKIPVVGSLISYGQIARLSRNLGTLIKSGVPIAHAIEITSETLGNWKFRNSLSKIAKSLTKGKNIGETMLEGKYDVFPPLVYRMISVGEKTGKLDETLLYLADFYEEEVDNISKNLSTILEPVLLIGIGLVVGFVALSIISPIYQLTGSIHQ